ncbi:MAG: S8 family serine peptidase [Blastocatellia bacterium]|nr:S8 family serine peptidase [Blastocatellia bacterium]
MRTSHKHTHTNPATGRRLYHPAVWMLLMVAVLVLPAIRWSTPSEAAKPSAATGENLNLRSPWTMGYRSRGDAHKLHVQDAALAKELVAKGGRVLADYGTYQLIEASAASASALAAGVQAELRDDNNLILLNSGAFDTSTLAARSGRANRVKTGNPEGKGMWLVQFVGPVKPEWYAGLEGTGVRVVNYIPNNAYLVYGDTASLNKLASWAVVSDHVQWQGEYLPQHKMSPELTSKAFREMEAKNASLARSGGATTGTAGAQQTSSYAQVQLIKDAQANSATIDQVNTLAGAQSIASQYDIAAYVNLTVKLPSSLTAEAFAKQLASRPDIVSIAPYLLPRKFDERQNIIVAGNLTGSSPTPGNYLTYLDDKGITQAQFTTSNFAVNVVDSGVDNATTNPNHFGLRTGGQLANASRVIYNRLEGTPNAGSTLQGCDGHGNINAHIVGGFVPTGNVGGIDYAAFPHADASGFRYGLGVAPFVKLGSTVIFDPNSFTFPSYPSIESKAYNDGARISTNSWGASVGGAYNSDSQAYDFLVRDAQPTGAPFTAAGNQEMVIVFAAGNDGSGANTVGSPGTAKNVITAGASENVHPFGAADQCGTPDSEANSAFDVVGFSSRGPCDDGRVKPDLMAPGSHVSGGVFQASATATGTGLAGGCFTAGGVCAGPGTSNFWPLNQQFYTASSGTSHSTPAIAGAAALVRQRFLNQSLTPPTPAMTKAALLNTASYMNGTGANDNLFSNNQGMGLLNLNKFFDLFSTPTVLRDQISGDTFTATGQQRVITGTISDSTKPFRVTLAWTDAPGSTTGNAFVNNLDLEVVVGGQTFKGNVFTGAFSSTGGAADIRNNVESVIIPAGVTGSFAVFVKATNIAGDGVPNSGGALDQDFALVIYNGVQAAAPIVASTLAVTAEECAVDGKADPGEKITVSLCLSNVGTVATGNVTASLAATGGVTLPSAAQSFGVLAPGGAAVCRTFSFTVDKAQACGLNTTATFSVLDGSTSLATIAQVFTSGTAIVTATENFDGVTAPALPAGWTATNATGAAPLWVTSTTSPSSAPNALFVDDPSTVSDKRIESPAYPISSSSAQLTFRHTYSFEGTTTFFDGGVLEVSIDGGAFVDVTSATAGGTFLAGGYTGAISSSFSNPIGGRQAWGGANAGGFGTYVTTTVQFGSALAGKTAKFRWRMGSDTTATGLGWRVDNIQVLGALQCCVGITPTVTITDPASCTGPGNNVTARIQVVNPSSSAITGSLTSALPAGLPALPGSCTANFGACTVVNASTVSWAGTVPGNGTLTIEYLAQVGDVNPGTQFTVTTSGSFGVVGVTPVLTPLSVNCPGLGPGNVIPTIAPGDGAAPPSDQKPGSVLFFPVYTSSSDPNRQNTRISMTNVNGARSANLHLFFVDGSTCAVADAYVCLTPNQTASFLASDLDPGTTGYLIAVATDVNGCPVNFNYLIGDEYVKFGTGHQANLSAEAVPAIVGSRVACPGSEARLRFDGIEYAPVPATLALDNVPSRADANDTLVIINRVGGDLLTFAATLTNLFGILYDDAEQAYSFSLSPRTCQFRGSVGNAFPRTTPRFEQVVPAGRSAWFKFYSTSDQGLFGAAINFNPNAAASASAFNQGHNLHKLSFTTGMSYAMPVLPVSCQ